MGINFFAVSGEPSMPAIVSQFIPVAELLFVLCSRALFRALRSSKITWGCSGGEESLKPERL
jgi:hypothetical protein